jgi:hypothetical protein
MLHFPCPMRVAAADEVKLRARDEIGKGASAIRLAVCLFGRLRLRRRTISADVQEPVARLRRLRLNAGVVPS